MRFQQRVFAYLFLLFWAGSALAAVVTGIITDLATGKPIAGATVMIQGTAVSTTSNADGRYVLDAGNHDLTVRHITAWQTGHVIGAALAQGGRADIALERLPPDDPDHAYHPAATCGGCHDDIHAQWQNTSMGRAMGEKLPQKLSFYLGETTAGRFDGLGFGWKFFAPMMGIAQGPHAMDLDHFIGTCSNCHARGVTWKKGVLEPHKSFDPDTGRISIDGAIKVFRMDRVADLPIEDGSEGITCDVCHSVEDVRIHRDSKGRISTVDVTRMEVIRRGDVKFGSFKDAVSPFHKTAYSPIFRKSEFCAMCHMERADDLEGIGV
ncbi:MAG: carboxypeptidase-like regulatory domain-containing protein, partial [Rhodocyclaceae bacterium]